MDAAYVECVGLPLREYQFEEIARIAVWLDLETAVGEDLACCTAHSAATPTMSSSNFAIHSRRIAWFVVVRSVCFTLLLPTALAQRPPEVDTQSGMSTGVARAPVKDALHRPITAGGFVDGAPVVFSDITHAAGVDKFHHVSDTLEKPSILETPGSGLALLDYANDGWLDIYLL